MNKDKDYKSYKTEPMNFVGATFTSFLYAADNEKIQDVVDLRKYLVELQESGSIRDASYTVKYINATAEWLNEVIQERTKMEN